MARGKLRIHLGSAPGVGKTYAMLSEAHRRVERGTDCVVAFVEHHDRPRTEVTLHGLEQVERQQLGYRGTQFTEMDVDAVIARHPAVAMVDELPHIDVVSTVNIQHLESLGDVVESITGPARPAAHPGRHARQGDPGGLRGGKQDGRVTTDPSTSVITPAQASPRPAPALLPKLCEHPRLVRVG